MPAADHVRDDSLILPGGTGGWLHHQFHGTCRGFLSHAQRCLGTHHSLPQCQGERALIHYCIYNLVWHSGVILKKVQYSTLLSNLMVEFLAVDKVCEVNYSVQYSIG